MTPRTREMIERANTSLRQFSGQLANPDACTAGELDSMASDLANIVGDLLIAAQDIERDEAAAIAFVTGNSVEGILE